MQMLLLNEKYFGQILTKFYYVGHFKSTPSNHLLSRITTHTRFSHVFFHFFGCSEQNELFHNNFDTYYAESPPLVNNTVRRRISSSPLEQELSVMKSKQQNSRKLSEFLCARRAVYTLLENVKLAKIVEWVAYTYDSWAQTLKHPFSCRYNPTPSYAGRK